MIEFKQIIGRGTRLYDGKYYFTIYDFVKAYEKFQDPTWDGDPVCTLPLFVVVGIVVKLLLEKACVFTLADVERDHQHTSP